MPTARVFTLRPERPAEVATATGRAAHAAVLDLIASADAALAAKLHHDERVKPLTVAGLTGLGGPGPAARVDPGRAYGLRVTLLDAELEALTEGWSAASVPTIRIGGVLWRVEDVTCDTARDPWAGRAGYQELLAPAVRRAAGAGGGRWTLEFVTPLTFRRQGRSQPLPLPELVFGSLLDRWNALSPLRLPDDLRQVVADGLSISRFELRSAVVPGKGGALQIGGLGRCTYAATGLDRYGMACVDALARFAFYSGVGAGTARGFGQARLLAEGRAAARPARDIVAP